MKAYGAQAYAGFEPFGGEAIGGPGSYPGLLTPDHCDEVVTTVSQFLAAIQKPGRHIWMGAFLDLTKYLQIPMADDILLASDLSGGVFNHNMSAGYVPLLLPGANDHFLGVTVEGPDPNYHSTYAPPYCDGIGAFKPGIVVESCEIRNWQYGGVRTSNDTRVIWNYIHHCQHNGIGYGVAVGGNNSDAFVMGNYFDYCRHFVMGECGLTSYELIYNIFGPHCSNTQIDCHGGHDDKCGSNIYGTPAGRRLRVHYNTSLCTTQRMMGVRGIPAEICEADHNWSYFVSGSGCAGLNCPEGWKVYAQVLGAPSDYSAKQPYIRMTQHDNWFGQSPPPDVDEPPVPPPPPPPAEPEIVLSNLIVSPNPVTVGQNLTVQVTASNTGLGSGSAIIELTGDWIDSKTVTLGPGESKVVTFLLTASIPGSAIVRVGDLSQIVLIEPAPVANITLSDLLISPAAVYPGQTVTVQVTATNSGGVAGTITVRLSGWWVLSQSVTVQPGESKPVIFTFAPSLGSSPGVRSIAVDGLSGTVTVLSSAPLPAQFVYSNLVINPTSVRRLQTSTVTVKVANTGGSSGTTTVRLTGWWVLSKVISLAAGASTTVTFKVTPSSTCALGPHPIIIGDLSGTLTVR